MLEVFINFISGSLLALSGFYIIQKIIDIKEKITLKVIIISIINSLFIVLIHYFNYSSLTPLIIFIVNIITYKLIFNKNIGESIIYTGILSVIMLIADMLSVIIQILLFSVNSIRNNIYVSLISNIIVIIIAILISNIPLVRKNISKFYKVLLKKDYKLNSLFIILLIVANCGVVYYVITNYQFNLSLFSNMLIIGSLVFLGVIFINNKDNYNKLSSQYDLLLQNVRNFEEWIEKEQFLRHEYKNQLAVIYSMSNERKVKEKVQEVINQNMKIENDVIYNLKNLPKGGIKGILYYKAIMAQNNKIKLTVDISIKNNGILKKLNNKKMDEVSKLIGIYFDNAIEAAVESRKKIISLEIYELKNCVNIIISNTFSNKSIIDNNTKKGVSSKGKGRGNGLYFANWILKNNKWMQEKHEIIDKYYIQTITILKSTSNK